MEYLFISSQVKSRIAALKKAGKSGKNLVHKATAIIDSIASGDVRCHMDAIESYTKYVENRIKYVIYHRGLGVSASVEQLSQSQTNPCFRAGNSAIIWQGHHTR